MSDPPARPSPGAAPAERKLIIAAVAISVALTGWMALRLAGGGARRPAQSGAPEVSVTGAGSALRPSPAGTIDIPWLPDTVARHRPVLLAAAGRHQVDPELLAIVTLVESGGYTRATSPSGARGLMQIMPSTGKVIASERALEEHSSDRLYDPAYNIDFGAFYLAEQLNAFGTSDPEESVELAAAAYNGGPSRLRRYLEDAGTQSAQTTRYRHWVRSMWEERALAKSPTYAAWYEAGGHRLVDLGRAEMAGKYPRGTFAP
ncbi:MAG: lytic transglycosylase domain-containing protein [Deltaproteobacteria bacterium]|nr:lytic transglycosylase domain-containing protein [Deltaproteobacteria bacterium]